MKRSIPEDYHTRRAEIYHPLREEGIFTWDQDAEDHEEYGLATIHPITEEFVKELQFASEQLGQIFARITQVVQQGDDELFRELGIPKNAWRAVRVPFDQTLPTWMGRFDFANTPDGLKLLEFNGDTPGGFVEAYHVNQRVCDYYGWQNPNQGLEQDIADAFQMAVQRYHELGYKTDRIVFSSKSSLEEVALTRYLLSQSGLTAQYVPVSKIYMKEGNMFAEIEEELQAIDLWCRYYAMTSMANAKSTTGAPIGDWMLNAVAQKRVAMLNPPQSLIVQTKALMALIWNLHEQNTFFAPHEHEIIETYMLPTYMENALLGKEAFVRKPVLGRQGGAVTLYDKDGLIISQDDEDDFWEQTMVYQKLVELETIKTMNMTGSYQGWLIWGCYIFGGRASAVITRLSEKITQDSSRYLPFGYAK